MENIDTSTLLDRAAVRLPLPPAVPFFGASADLVVTVASVAATETATVRPGARKPS